MKTILLSAALTLAAFGVMAGGAYAQNSDPEVTRQSAPAPVITPDTQVFTPANSDMTLAGIYPKRAQDSDIEGTAAVICQIGATGDLTQCVIDSENPKGAGFGKAVAITMLKWAHVDTSKAGQQPGDWMKLAAAWKLHD